MKVPVSFEQAVEKVAPYIEQTEHVIVEIADTQKNEDRLNTLATIYEVSRDEVDQAVVAYLEEAAMQPSPDQEQIDHLVHLKQQEFSEAGN